MRNAEPAPSRENRLREHKRQTPDIKHISLVPGACAFWRHVHSASRHMCDIDDSSRRALYIKV